MPIHNIKLIKRQVIATNTNLFVFEKPLGLTFKPGQYGGFTLIKPTENDPAGITRRFSLLSIPEDEHLAIATRTQHSAYKRNLNHLPVGGEIKFAGPTGKFTLIEDQTAPIVLIAGGIGIAPFYSMIRYVCHHQLPYQVYLFYGNQTLADTAFLTELKELEKTNKRFKLIATMANPATDWQGETGFITQKMIKAYLPDIFIPYYYICGSPAMVTTLQETLAEMAIDEDRIFTEDFPGY